MASVTLVATSRAEDVGFIALADLANIAASTEYVIIGGHMVHILMHVYPCDRLTRRGTADADAGIGPVAAAGNDLHDRLLRFGYEATRGNSYRRTRADLSPQIDLLVPGGGGDQQELLGGRQFDVAPGLSLALSQRPMIVAAFALLTDGTELRFSVPIPSVESAVVMKTLVRQTRLAAKDLTDLSNLLELAHDYGRESDFGWQMDRADRVSMGTRMDTARILHALKEKIDRGLPVLGDSGVSGPRLSALIGKLVARPG